MQMDFASDQLFSLLFCSEFHFVPPAPVCRPMECLWNELLRKGDLIKMWSTAKWTVDKPAACLPTGFGAEEKRCAANDSQGVGCPSVQNGAPRHAVAWVKVEEHYLQDQNVCLDIYFLSLLKNINKNMFLCLGNLQMCQLCHLLAKVSANNSSWASLCCPHLVRYFLVHRCALN